MRNIAALNVLLRARIELSKGLKLGGSDAAPDLQFKFSKSYPLR
jgi:hypothetical protein